MHKKSAAGNGRSAYIVPEVPLLHKCSALSFIKNGPAAFNGSPTALLRYEESQKQLEILRVAQAQLNAFHAPILEHLRERDVLAQRGLQVEPVALAGEQFDMAAASVYRFKKALGFGDVPDLHCASGPPETQIC